MTSKKQRSADKDAFANVARRLECDEDKDRFEAALGKIAKVSPRPNKPLSQAGRKKP